MNDKLLADQTDSTKFCVKFKHFGLSLLALHDELSHQQLAKITQKCFFCVFWPVKSLLEN